MSTTHNFKIKLVSAVDQKSATESYAEKVVIFDVPPSVVETGNVDYEMIQIIQGPTSFQAYRGTPARTFSMTDVKLISRTTIEARDNIQKLNILRGWRMPYFGSTATEDAEKAVKDEQLFTASPGYGHTELSPLARLKNSSSTLNRRLGAPPEILLFSAYANSPSTPGSVNEDTLRSGRGNIHRVPVVLTSLSITYPNDVSYVMTSKRGNIDALGGVPFPSIMTITIELAEAHSPSEASKFNLAKYSNGVLEGF